MKETKKFLIPDYFLGFSCKMGGCRAACCEGWPISVSMKNYFHLLGLDCPKPLRDRLDCGLRMVDHPTEEQYARFEPRYDGNCPMRMEDGRCSLHAELGEDVLPDVCRLYPRGIRLRDGRYECSLANSCEGVIEMFLEKEEPITFSFAELPLQPPPHCERKNRFETLGAELEIRIHLISVMKDRRMTLPQRMMCLCQVLHRLDLAIKEKDHAMLREILSESPYIDHDDFGKKEIDSRHLCFGLQIIEQLMESLDARSDSIRLCGEAALAYFGEGEDALHRYRIARARFEERYPNWEIFYEHMLVNHMFFSQFPFQDRPESMHDEFVALCAVYGVMRFLGLGSTADGENETALIDGMAAAFRLIEHADFDRYASRLLRRLNCTSREQLFDLLVL